MIIELTSNQERKENTLLQTEHCCTAALSFGLNILISCEISYHEFFDIIEAIFVPKYLMDDDIISIFYTDKEAEDMQKNLLSFPKKLRSVSKQSHH